MVRTGLLKGARGLAFLANRPSLSKSQFLASYAELLQSKGIQVPLEVQEDVFDLFDHDRNGVVDMMELIPGISLFCGGTDEEKVQAVFRAYGNCDGAISIAEMSAFMSSVFRVGLTPKLLAAINSQGLQVESPEELAYFTALECFQEADLTKDGHLTLDQFKAWFFSPQNDPALFLPRFTETAV
ncbi:unnamed protein product [Effrenium voratum]|nr:unnamed protein product [Effrenium voratum]